MSDTHDAAVLTEFKADNAQDDQRAREIVQAMGATRQTLEANAERLRGAIGQQTALLESGPGISPREAAVYILAGLPASATASTARRVLRERLAILEEVAPIQAARPGRVDRA